MASIEKRSGRYLVRWTKPDGRSASQAARGKREARALNGHVESRPLTGYYVAQETRKQVLDAYVVEVPKGKPSLERPTPCQHEKLYQCASSGTLPANRRTFDDVFGGRIARAIRRINAPFAETAPRELVDRARRSFETLAPPDAALRAS